MRFVAFISLFVCLFLNRMMHEYSRVKIKVIADVAEQLVLSSSRLLHVDHCSFLPFTPSPSYNHSYLHLLVLVICPLVIASLDTIT